MFLIITEICSCSKKTHVLRISKYSNNLEVLPRSIKRINFSTVLVDLYYRLAFKKCQEYRKLKQVSVGNNTDFKTCIKQSERHLRAI